MVVDHGHLEFTFHQALSLDQHRCFPLLFMANKIQKQKMQQNYHIEIYCRKVMTKISLTVMIPVKLL